MSPVRVHSVSALVLVHASLLLGWGFWDSLFDSGPAAPDASAARAAVVAGLADARALHPATVAVYGSEPALLWRASAQRRAAASALARAPFDGISAEAVRAPVALQAVRAADEADAWWHGLDDAARDTLADPRPALLATADVRLSDGLMRLGDALRGRRTDAAMLYRGTWFPYVRDTADVAFDALGAALRTGDARRVARALDALRPQQAGYERLRERLVALQEDLAPIPAGPVLSVGGRSVRVPHLRERLVAYGYVAADTLGAWERPEPYLLDSLLASGLAQFEQAHGLPVNRALEAADTDVLNADPAALRARLALNLERWRWLPDTFGSDYVWVNIPAFELRVMHASGGQVEERLQMPVNVGNAQTTGWTTPVIRDSIHTVEFQPAWYVPASLAGGLFAAARADSLTLWRRGVDVTLNGRPVDSRLVLWDSVSSAGFRFVQRPGAQNPLGRVKFLMHNPYAILIHDTDKRYTLDDGVGSSMSSGCVQAGAPDKLAEYLLTTVNGWAPGEAEAAYRRGPRRGVRLETPFPSQFVYFTASAEVDGRLRLFGDPYGYDRRLATALGLDLGPNGAVVAASGDAPPERPS